MGYSFDGVNRKVQLTAGTTYVDVGDMYSRWYDWLLLSDNAKYPLAFRNVGGDPISDVKDLGITYFLTNGWRIVPQSADHRLTVDGNLFTDPFGESPIDTVPGYSIIVEYSVSNLVDSSLAQMPEIEYASFAGGVTVDETSEHIGTEYPIGTPQAPVNNLTDALAIAQSRGFGTFFIVGDATIDAGGDYSGKQFIGESMTKSVLTVDPAANVTKAEFYDCTLGGTLDGQALAKNCRITTLAYINGVIQECILEDGVITLGGGARAIFLDCWCGDPGASAPAIDCGGTGQELVIRNYTGGLRIRNKAGTEEASITLLSGQVTVESTVTAGTVRISGLGTVVDQSGGTADVDISELLNPAVITDAIVESMPEIGNAIFDGQEIETGLNFREMMRIVAAVLAGLADGFTGSTGDDVVRYMNALVGNKARVTALVDRYGNRKTVNLDVSD